MFPWDFKLIFFCNAVRFFWTFLVRTSAQIWTFRKTLFDLKIQGIIWPSDSGGAGAPWKSQKYPVFFTQNFASQNLHFSDVFEVFRASEASEKKIWVFTRKNTTFLLNFHPKQGHFPEIPGVQKLAPPVVVKNLQNRGFLWYPGWNFRGGPDLKNTLPPPILTFSW